MAIIYICILIFYFLRCQIRKSEMNTCQPFDVEGQTNIELQTSASLIRLGGWDSQDAPSLLNKNDIVIIDYS